MFCWATSNHWSCRLSRETVKVASDLETEPQQPGSISVSNSISIGMEIVWSLQVKPCSGLCLTLNKETMSGQFKSCHHQFRYGADWRMSDWGYYWVKAMHLLWNYLVGCFLTRNCKYIVTLHDISILFYISIAGVQNPALDDSVVMVE